MNHKVLLADDSLTIQKVIKITLANQPYDITDCSTEEELFSKISSVQPKVVFLDFNLSEKYTGYELTSKIKSLSPSTKVLLLLGTFDTVDDAALEKCGASEKIVKPFDSNKFIAICKQLIDTFAEGDLPMPVASKAAATPPANSDDQWKVSHSTSKLPASPESKPLDRSIPIANQLDQEVSDWGMSIPEIISGSEKEDQISLPPVMEARKSADRPFSTEAKFPTNDDLDFPTIDELRAKSDKKPTLVSTNNFAPEPLVLENFSSPQPESDVSHIEAQIKDEVEENLWQVDEFEDLKKQVSSRMEEMQNAFNAETNFDEHLFNPTTDESVAWNEKSTELPTSPFGSSVNNEEIMQNLRGEMESLIKKHVREYMDEMFQKNVEKISWEIIPDLAENLIRKELSKIAEKIIDDQSR